MSKRSATTAALDRIVEASIGGSPNDSKSFFPSASWQGSKHGYYFRREQDQTGYFRDLPATSSLSKKRAKAGVQFAEDQNETRVIVSGAQLLAEAEERASETARFTMDLSIKGIQSARRSLQQAWRANQQQREQYPGDPEKYLDTEVILYERVVVTKAVAAGSIGQLYPVLRQENEGESLVSMLVQLLLHENLDVVRTVVSVWVEWLDPSLAEGESGDAVLALGQLILEQAAEGLLEVLQRLETEERSSGNVDEDDETTVGRGVADVFQLFENLLEIDAAVSTEPKQSLALTICKESPMIVSWLVQQVNIVASPWKGRSLEVLALLVSSPFMQEAYKLIPDWSKLKGFEENGSSSQHKKEKKKPTLDAIESLLQCIATYRKTQPSEEAQIDELENASLVLAALVLRTKPHLVPAFVEQAQGIQLVLRCLKERVHSGGVTLKLLDFGAKGGPENCKACEHFIEAGGLAVLCDLVMGKNLPKRATASTETASLSKREQREWNETLQDAVIRILFGLVRHLRDDSPRDSKTRLLAKLVKPERCDRLVELLLIYDEKARMAEYVFYQEQDDEEDEEPSEEMAVEARLAGGGDLLHRLAATIAFVCVGSKKGHERVLESLQAKESGITVVQQALAEFYASLNADESTLKDQLQTYLDGI